MNVVGKNIEVVNKRLEVDDFLYYNRILVVNVGKNVFLADLTYDVIDRGIRTKGKNVYGSNVVKVLADTISLDVRNNEVSRSSRRRQEVMDVLYTIVGRTDKIGIDGGQNGIPLEGVQISEVLSVRSNFMNEGTVIGLKDVDRGDFYVIKLVVHSSVDSKDTDIENVSTMNDDIIIETIDVSLIDAVNSGCRKNIFYDSKVRCSGLLNDNNSKKI